MWPQLENLEAGELDVAPPGSWDVCEGNRVTSSSFLLRVGNVNEKQRFSMRNFTVMVVLLVLAAVIWSKCNTVLLLLMNTFQ